MLLIFWWYASNPHLSSKQCFIWRSSSYCVRCCSICHHFSHYFCFVICLGHLCNCCCLLYLLHVVFCFSICLRIFRSQFPVFRSMKLAEVTEFFSIKWWSIVWLDFEWFAIFCKIYINIYVNIYVNI